MLCDWNDLGIYVHISLKRLLSCTPNLFFSLALLFFPVIKNIKSCCPWLGPSNQIFLVWGNVVQFHSKTLYFTCHMSYDKQITGLFCRSTSINTIRAVSTLISIWVSEKRRMFYAESIHLWSYFDNRLCFHHLYLNA